MSAERTVLVACHEDVLGGATLAVVRALPALRELGWRFVMWAPRPSPLFDELAAAGHEVRGAPRPVSFSLAGLRLAPGPRARLAGLPGYVRAFRAALEEEEPALVHANSILSLPEAVVAHRKQTPVLLHVHEMLSGVKGRLAARAARWATDEVVAVSAACAFALARRGCPARVVHGGVPLDDFHPGAATDREHLVVGNVGTISRRKGSDLYVEAARLVGERAPEVRFEMVGAVSEPLDAEWAAGVLERAREIGIEHRERADVASALREWDVVVLPSRADPFPNVTLEAMASGVPVIGARVDGIPEQIAPDTGLLVEPESPGALADAILRLRDDPERRAELGTAARRRVASEFTPERQVEGLDRAYRAALAGRGEAR